MLAATDSKTKVTVIAAPSIPFPFESIRGRVDDRDSRFYLSDSVVLIGTGSEHCSYDLQYILGAGLPLDSGDIDP